MPAKSERQRRFMGAELARKRRGEATETGMSESQLRDFAKKRKKKKRSRHQAPNPNEQFGPQERHQFKVCSICGNRHPAD